MLRSKTKKRPVSLTLRVGLGKLFGAAIGMVVFFSLPALQADIDMGLRLGMWGWYIIFGAVIGFAGIYVKYPLFGWPLPAVLRGAIIGLGMNAVLGGLVHQDMILAFSHYSDFQISNSKPIIQLAIEGLIWGALIDVALTFYAGQGKGLVKKL